VVRSVPAPMSSTCLGPGDVLLNARHLHAIPPATIGRMPTIRGAVLDGPNQDLRIAELELAPPGDHEVQLRYGASGVCHSDLHVADGEWSAPYPIVLGHEGAGVVE